MECSKSDWKLFRSWIVEWQERYIEKLLTEYVQLLNGSKNASDKFWELERRIRKDRKHPGIILEMSKKNMAYDIADLINYGVISVEDLKEFSDELKERVGFLSTSVKLETVLDEG